MSLLLFCASYALGLSSAFIEPARYVTYIMGLFVYLVAVNALPNRLHRKSVIRPLVLSFSSSLLLGLWGSERWSVAIGFACVVAFLAILTAIKGKAEKAKKETQDLHFYCKRLVLPFVFPVAVYFVAATFLPGDLATYAFVLLYFVILLSFSRLLLTRFYVLLFTGGQALVLWYLFPYLEAVTAVDKGSLAAVMVFNSVVQFYYNQKEIQQIGGNRHHRFVRNLPERKRV